MEPHCDYSKWFYLCLSLVGVIFAGLVMVFRYFLKLDRNGVRLGQADKIQEQKHYLNEQRIKQLEKQVNDLQKKLQSKK